MGQIFTCKIKKGETAFSTAAETGHLDLVKYLHQNGANIHTADKEGQTALIKAAVYNKEGKDATTYFFTWKICTKK
jgi:ankyrin repeat protein